jgi:predicted nucleic acid-binding protein
MKKYCIDACVFLNILFPTSSKAIKEDMAGSEKVVSALSDGKILGITTSIVLAEIKWVFCREEKDGFEIAYHTLTRLLRRSLTIVEITNKIAIEAAGYRCKYYSRINQFSYNDGLYLSTAVNYNVDAIISTDTHLLKVDETKTISPREFNIDL